MSFLSSLFSNFKSLYTSRASEPIQVNSVWQFSVIYLQQGFQDLLDVQLFRSCSKHGGISSSSSPNPLCALILWAMGWFIGICNRFGCVKASCTCTDAPLPSGFGGIIRISKLARFLQQSFRFKNTRQFHSPLSSAFLCEVVEWRLQNTVEIEEYPLQ